MLRKFFALFFSVLFMASIVLPAITLVVEGDIELVELFDTNEEQKEQETHMDTEVKYIEKHSMAYFYNDDSRKETNYVYFFNHSEHYIGINLPPPELI